MTRNTDIKSAEKFAYQTLSVDGLADFWAGITLLMIGFGWAYDLVVIAAISPVITLPLWRASRKWLSEPRLGSVNLVDEKRYKISMKLSFTVLLGSAFLGVFAYFAYKPGAIDQNLLQDLIPMMPAFILAIMAALGAWLLAAPRFLAYAAWLVAAAYYGISSYGHPSAPMILGSLLPIAGGIVHFARFAKSNPKVGD